MDKLKLKNFFVIALIIILSVILIGFLTANFGLLSLILWPILAIVILAVVKIFKDPFWGFLLIIFFLPFERVPTYNLGGTDIKINVVLGLIVLVSWILALFFNGKKWQIQPNALSIPLSLFVLALLMSLTQAVDFSRAVTVLIFTLFTIFLSLLTVSMVKDRETLKKTVVVLLFSALIVAAFGFYQFGGDVVGLPLEMTLLKIDYSSKVFGFPRIQAFSMEPLYLANYLLIPISLLLAYFFAKINLKKDDEDTTSFWLKLFANRNVILILLTALLIVFVLTVSRGGYLALAAALAIFAVFYFKKVFTLRNVTLVIALLLVYYGVTYALSQGEYRASREFFGHISLNDYEEGESIQGRFQLFRLAFQAYSRNPVLGIGLGNYGPYEAVYPPVTPEGGWKIVNNQYIELLAETGIVGTVTYILILIVLLVRSLIAFRYAHDDFLKATLLGLTAAFVGVLVQYNTFSTLYIIHIWILIGLLVAVQNIIFKTKKFEKAS